METTQNIRNDALVQAYQALHAENTRPNQEAVTRNMVKATFLLPVLPVENAAPEDFPPKVLKNEQGQIFLPLFTDEEQTKAAMPGLCDCLLPIDISDAYSHLVEKQELQGIIINAFSKPNLICPRAMVENLAKLWSRVKTAELNGENPESAFQPPRQDLKLMVPKVYAEGVAEALADGLKQQSDIEKAWMCMVQKKTDETPETMDWMVIMQASEPLKGREDAFRAIGQALTAIIGKHNIIFAENNLDLRNLTDKAQPIYVRDAQESEA